LKKETHETTEQPFQQSSKIPYPKNLLNEVTKENIRAE